MDTPVQRQREQGNVHFERAGDETLIVHLSGAWCLRSDMPPASLLEQQLNSAKLRRVAFDSSDLTNWDSALISFLTLSGRYCRALGIEQDRSRLQDGLKHLVELAEAVPEKKGARSEAQRPPFLSRVGNATLACSLALNDFLSFIGELTLAASKFVFGRARYRRSDLLEAIQQCGARRSVSSP